MGAFPSELFCDVECSYYTVLELWDTVSRSAWKDVL